jgi:hypothetical protein
MKNGNSFLKLTNDSVTPSMPAACWRTSSSTIFSGRPISGCELKPPAYRLRSLKISLVSS